MNIYPTTIRFYNTFGNRRNYFYFSDGSVYEINETTEAPAGGVYLEAPVPEGTKLEKVLCKFNGIFAALQIDGSIVKDGETIVGPTTLVFGSNADMAPLAAGDEVEQTTAIGTQPTWSTNVDAEFSVGTAASMYDGNDNSFGGTNGQQVGVVYYFLSLLVSTQNSLILIQLRITSPFLLTLLLGRLILNV